MPKTTSVVRLCAASLLAALVGGCGPSSESSGSPPRSGLTEIFRGELWQDDSCSEQHFENCLTPGTGLSIASVRVVGNRVGVVILADGDHLILALSEDRAKTFHLVQIDDDDFTRGGQIYRGGMDLFLSASGTGTWLYLPRPESGAGGRTYSRGYFYAINAAASLVKLPFETQNMPGAPPLDAQDGRAIFIVPDSDFRGGPATLLTSEVDPADRANDLGGSVTCDNPACGYLRWGAFQGSDDGDVYYGFSSTAPGGGSECLFSYGRTTKMLGYRCVPLSEWPAAADHDNFAVVPYAGQKAPLLRAFNTAGHAWAVTILESLTSGPHSVSRPVDLGAGALFSNGSFSGRQRHPGLAIVTPLAPTGDAAGVPVGAVASPLTTRLVRVQQDGLAEDVGLPRSPCVDDGTCGDRAARSQQVYGQVAWSEPLGGDEYLEIYLVDAEPALNRFRAVVSASVERATIRAIEPTVFPSNAGPAGFPDAVEANAIEKMCVRALSCLGGSGGPYNDDIPVCLQYWMTETPATAAAHRSALLDFLAAPADCSGFRYDKLSGFWGNHLCRQGCEQAGGHCTPNDTTQLGVCTFPATDPADCNRCSADGRAVSCSGTTVTSVLDCASVGQACDCSKDPDGACLDAPKCVTPACAGTEPVTCVDNVWTHCSQKRDCAVPQLDCSMTPGTAYQGCDATGAFTGTSGCAGGNPVRCDGKYLLHCVGGRLHWTDCLELGFAGCSTVSGTNAERCQP